MTSRSYGRVVSQTTDPSVCDGILLVDKPSGMTSHDVVAKIRRHFPVKKVGHGGTLDPAATGLLVILLGKGTKLSDFIMGGDKTYAGTIKLGVTTDSQDADGEVLETRPCDAVTEDQIKAAMTKYVGDISQIPPMVSAIKVKGVPLYKMAREGKTIERKPRNVHIYEYRLDRFELPEADVLVRCTKGTYIRTLAYDVGEDLGCGGHLCALRRLGSGKFTIDDGYQLDDIMSWDFATLRKNIVPCHQVRSPA